MIDPANLCFVCISFIFFSISSSPLFAFLIWWRNFPFEFAFCFSRKVSGLLDWNPFFAVEFLLFSKSCSLLFSGDLLRILLFLRCSFLQIASICFSVEFILDFCRIWFIHFEWGRILICFQVSLATIFVLYLRIRDKWLFWMNLY